MEGETFWLDAIIAAGYRVNSKQATQFRIWATQTLKEFIVKGFLLDDERLKLTMEDYIADLNITPSHLKILFRYSGDTH